jgi:hypothetical protein
MAKVLFWSFETWLIWINLLLMTVFAEIGIYYSDAPVSAASPPASLLYNITILVNGLFFTMFDAFKVCFHFSFLLEICFSRLNFLSANSIDLAIAYALFDRSFGCVVTHIYSGSVRSSGVFRIRPHLCVVLL